MSNVATATKASEAGTDSAVAIVVSKTSLTEKVLRIVIPVAMVVLAIGLWQLHITVNNVPHYIMPAPGKVVETLFTDWPTLYPSLLVTVRVTLTALALALIGGVGPKTGERSVSGGLVRRHDRHEPEPPRIVEDNCLAVRHLEDHMVVRLPGLAIRLKADSTPTRCLVARDSKRAGHSKMHQQRVA